MIQCGSSDQPCSNSVHLFILSSSDMRIDLHLQDNIHSSHLGLVILNFQCFIPWIWAHLEDTPVSVKMRLFPEKIKGGGRLRATPLHGPDWTKGWQGDANWDPTFPVLLPDYGSKWISLLPTSTIMPYPHQECYHLKSWAPKAPSPSKLLLSWISPQQWEKELIWMSSFYFL